MTQSEHEPPMGDREDESAAARPDSGIFGLSCAADTSRVIIVPVPFEATVSYRAGTATAPAAILEASRQVDLFDLHTGRPYEAGIAMLEAHPDLEALAAEGRALAEPVIEAGGTSPERPDLLDAARSVDDICSHTNAIVCAEVSRIADDDRIPGVVGGEHGVAFGAIEALARRWPGLGVLQVDAHADLRRSYEGLEWSHASVMANVLARIPGVARIVQVGVRDLCEAEYQVIASNAGRISTWFDPWLRARKQAGRTWAELARDIVADLPEQVYVSFDIDGLEPSLCPHTGTPVPGGLTFPEAIAILDAVVASGRIIVGFDLTEVAPGRDAASWDAIVGARVLYKLIGFALLSRSWIAPGVLLEAKGGPNRAESGPA